GAAVTLLASQPAFAVPVVREEREDDAEAVHPPEEAGTCACDPDRPHTPGAERHRGRAGIRLHPPRALLRVVQIHLWDPAVGIDEGQAGGLKAARRRSA